MTEEELISKLARPIMVLRFAKPMMLYGNTVGQRKSGRTRYENACNDIHDISVQYATELGMNYEDHE